MNTAQKSISPNIETTVIDLVNGPNKAPAKQSYTLNTTHIDGNLLATTRSLTNIDQFVNTIELPECLCVETNFISSAAAAKENMQNVDYTNSNNYKEGLGRFEKSVNNMNPKPTVTVSVKTGMPISSSSTLPTITLQRSNTIIKPIVPSSNRVVFSTATLTPLSAQITITNSCAQHSPQTIITSDKIVPLTSPCATNSTLTNIPVSKSVPVTQPIVKSVAAILKKINVETMREGKGPIRDRGQQTDNLTPTMRSIAIQCNRDNEVVSDTEDNNLEAEGCVIIDNEAEVEAEKIEDFKKFLAKSSHQYKFGYRECLICGEITNNYKNFLAHMSVHWGPGVLCFKCGKKLEHKSLLCRHCCSPCYWHRYQAASSLRCPHFRCGVIAISPWELRDHLNEHLASKQYSCRVCCKAFHTYGELKHHVRFRATCHSKVKLSRHDLCSVFSKKCRQYRARVYIIYTLQGTRVSLKRHLTNKYRACQICLRKVIWTPLNFNRHMQRCTRWHLQRIKRFQPNVSFTNTSIKLV